MSTKKKVTKTLTTKSSSKNASSKAPKTKSTSMSSSVKVDQKSISKKSVLAETKKSKPKAAPISAAEKEQILLKSRKKRATPSIFKIRSKKSTPIVFSLEDVKAILRERNPQGTSLLEQLPKKSEVKLPKKTEARKVTQEPIQQQFKEPIMQKRTLGAASLADILGFNPKEAKPPVDIEESKVPKDLLKYYKALVDLRTRVLEGLQLHSRDTLKRSSKEDSGDLSGYGQHMADAGTDTFDRDFALSLLSSEQDALFEIEEAIQRIIKGGYGICEITNVPISKERLKAVPFTRYSLEGQKQLESSQRTSKERGSIFADSSLEESAKYTEDFED